MRFPHAICGSFGKAVERVLILEDPEFEAFSIEEGDIIVPLSVVFDGELSVRAYACAEGIARAYLAQFGHDPFSLEARAFLERELVPLAHTLGFETEDGPRGSGRMMLTFEPTEATYLIATDKAQLLAPPFPAENLTSIDPAEEEPVFAVVENGAIVSAATVNPPVYGEIGAELTVETAPAFRGRAYAASCIALAAQYLQAQGERVVYRCFAENEASRRAVTRAGFSCTAKEYDFVAYRKL